LAAAGRSPRGLTGFIWAAQFCLCGYAAATMLWVNHRACLVRLGATTPEFYREVTLELKRFLRALARQAVKASYQRPQLVLRPAQELRIGQMNLT